ncbi:MAG: VOC family protein [Candidatus Rokubacteria bacterium]|nr:VOC family protein [Candidatus Rokubacteria bacterium]
MRVERVGHVVLKVRDLERSVPFYRDVLGLREVARLEDRPSLRVGATLVFFSATGANHHDIGLLEVGADAPAAPSHGVGLYHVALKIGDSLDDLRAAKRHLDAQGARILGVSDHRVSQSIYLADPDGNVIEVYVDADPRVWQQDPSAVASVGPLAL